MRPYHQKGKKGKRNQNGSPRDPSTLLAGILSSATCQVQGQLGKTLSKTRKEWQAGDTLARLAILVQTPVPQTGRKQMPLATCGCPCEAETGDCGLRPVSEGDCIRKSKTNPCTTLMEGNEHSSIAGGVRAGAVG